MGDRGNIVIRQEKDSNLGDVWFYTHWSGYQMKEVIRTALAKKARWDDFSYLARIIFDVLTEGEQGKETGFGISTSIGDNSYPIVVVDCPGQRVFEIEESSLKGNKLPNKLNPGRTWTFAEFSALPQQTK